MAAPPRVVRRRARRRRGAALGAGLLVLVAVVAGVLVLRGDDEPSRAAPVRPPATVAPTTVPASDPTLRAASTDGRDIPIYAAPDAAAAPVDVLSAQTEYLLPRTLLAFNTQRDWLQVHLPTRPNGSTGWVKRTDVAVSPTPLEYSVRVDLAAYQVSVLRNGVVEYTLNAAIGSPEYPTPTGTFFVTDPLDLRDQPGTGYGVFAIGLSGHSDVLTDFMGGDGQIAIHGTDNPSDIGQAISHGCVRLNNDDIMRLSTLPLGTPVVIT